MNRWRIVVLTVAVVAAGAVAIWLAVRGPDRAEPAAPLAATHSGAVTTRTEPPSRPSAVQPDAVAVTRMWMAAWLTGPAAPSQDAWLAGLADYTTTRFHRLLESTDRTSIPTGAVASVTGYPAPTHAVLVVTLTGGTQLQVTAERAVSTGPWLVADVRPATGPA